MSPAEELLALRAALEATRAHAQRLRIELAVLRRRTDWRPTRAPRHAPPMPTPPSPPVAYDLDPKILERRMLDAAERLRIPGASVVVLEHARDGKPDGFVAVLATHVTFDDTPGLARAKLARLLVDAVESNVDHDRAVQALLAVSLVGSGR